MRFSKTLRFFILSILVSLPLAAQERTSGEVERGRGSIDVAPGGTSVAGRGISVGGAGNSGAMTSSPSRGSSDFSSVGGMRNSTLPTPGSTFNAPRLQGTSFNSLNSYYLWQDFLWSLRTRYMLDPMYFSRFYRNSEPLVTPQLLKLAVREPLSLSSQMLTAVDELEIMLADLQAGKPVQKKEITEKAQQIRDLAKKVRRDHSLSFLDQRLDKNLTDGERYDKLGLEAVRELREMVTDLNTQLKGMYQQDTTSSVSVQSLSQPSFESLSKGIEKLAKIIESSARRL